MAERVSSEKQSESGLPGIFIPTLAPYILPRLLPCLQQRYAQLRLELRETQTKLLLDELSGGELDCALSVAAHCRNMASDKGQMTR